MLCAFVPTSVVLLILAVLVAFTLRSENLPAGGIGLVLGVVIGVIGNHVDRFVSSGGHSLTVVMYELMRLRLFTEAEVETGTVPDCQRTQFMQKHLSLISPDPIERDAVYVQIMEARTCYDAAPCEDHRQLANASEATPPPAEPSRAKQPPDSHRFKGEADPLAVAAAAESASADRRTDTFPEKVRDE